MNDPTNEILVALAALLTIVFAGATALYFIAQATGVPQ